MITRKISHANDEMRVLISGKIADMNATDLRVVLVHVAPGPPAGLDGLVAVCEDMAHQLPQVLHIHRRPPVFATPGMVRNLGLVLVGVLQLPHGQQVRVVIAHKLCLARPS